MQGDLAVPPARHREHSRAEIPLEPWLSELVGEDMCGERWGPRDASPCTLGHTCGQAVLPGPSLSHPYPPLEVI